MINIRISYTEDKDLHRVIEALKSFKVINRKSKPVERQNHKSLYLELE